MNFNDKENMLLDTFITRMSSKHNLLKSINKNYYGPNNSNLLSCEEYMIKGIIE
jgi:hypothetical protein